MFTKWMKDQDKILQGQSQCRRIGSGKKAFFPALEEYLCASIKLRNERGLMTNGPMIKRLAITYIAGNATEEEKESFKASNGWLENFLKRNAIASRMPTHVAQQNKRNTTDTKREICEFIPKVRAFSREYGETNLFNFDETPIYVDSPMNRTYVPRGSKSVRIITTNNEKLRFTVGLTISAAGKLLPAFVIFKGLKKVI